MRKTVLSRQFGAAVLQGLLAGLLLGAAFAGGFLYHAHFVTGATGDTDYGLLQEIEANLDRYFLYPLPEQDSMVHSAAAGMVQALDDPYTFFVEPQMAEIDENSLAGSFGGIGAEIAVDDEGRYVIANVYRDNPAYAAGIQAGDVILAVDELDVVASDVGMNELLAAIRGDVGDPVVLTLQRGDDTLTITVVRAEVLVPSVFWEVLEADDRVGYIQIVRFTTRTAEEVEQAIRALGAERVGAFVVDLRGNGGGLVDAAVDVVSQFVSGGVVLYEQRQGGDERVFSASRGGAALDEPLVVLVDGSTASAAEIVSGALQDRGRATLVGEPTFGKGSVQLILSLSDASSLHVTTAEWYTPDRHRIQDQGLTPDVPADAADDGAVFQQALEVLDRALSVAAVNEER